MFEYLVAEVLDQLRPELATFLERVSVLPELETSRCGAVAAAPNAALLLDEVERVGLCFDVLDAPVRTLRLHDLLRDALQRRLEIGQPQRLADLRQLAAATEPDALRRIGLLLDAGDPGAAAQAVFEHGPPTVPLGLSSSLMHLVGRFPAAFREKSPELHFVRGLVGWEHWDFAAMLSHMERAEAGFADAGDPERERLARAYRSCALIARGRVNEAAPLLEALSSARLSPVARIVMLNGLSWLRMETGRIRGVAPLITEMVALLEQVDRLDLWFQTTPPTRVPGMPGMTPTLMRHAEQLLRVAGDRPTPLRALATLVQAWNPFWRGDIAEAVRLREIARADAEWTGASAAVQGHLLTLTALGHAVRGDHATAISIATARVRNHQAGYGSYGRYVVLQAAARIATICGDAAALRGFVQQMAVAQAALGAAEAPERIRPQGPTIAQLAWLEGRADEAIGLWQDALRHEEEIDILCQAAETRVRLARALVRRGDIDQAAVTLAPVFERALEQGGPGGALLATDALRELAAAPWGAALADEQQATLRRWWQLLADDRSTYSGGSATHEPPESPQTQPRGAAVAGLTARETEVLARIAAGDSNKLIARQFDLSLHTVKRHVANILGKLGVATRGQAAAWYRQAGDASTRVLRG
jgi:LuxR family maltose regulon positive regulatory protein